MKCWNYGGFENSATLRWNSLRYMNAQKYGNIGELSKCDLDVIDEADDEYPHHMRDN